jgi:hypothetical protein
MQAVGIFAVRVGDTMESESARFGLSDVRNLNSCAASIVLLSVGQSLWA